MTNQLINESSPYLLQHAHNPVEWYPWGEMALQKASTENKPILVSIGYSACHWCHVMERESFENQAIATIMNQYFVCIKIDREERPDIDAVYMEAVQAMGVHGGWPLNVFLMPDTKPFYGGTYFAPQKWVELLQSIGNAFGNHQAQLQESANGFANNMQAKESEKYNLRFTNDDLRMSDDIALLHLTYQNLARNFDTQKGGMKRSPKFPMPSIWAFLLRYIEQTNNAEAIKQLNLTLTRIACGGIYDQLGGGWTRYSTDDEWFAPHFEKMLYDNGQLLSIYADAYCLTKNQLYKAVVYQTIAWAEREMLSSEFGFYSALDADSEGDEGKYYCWPKAEIETILGEDAPFFCELFQITEEGNWEHEKNILHSEEEIYWKPAWREKLLATQETRIKPGLDDKILCSWNGLMLKGLVDAYRVFGEPQFLDLAIKNAIFIDTKMTILQDNEAQLLHNYKNNKATIPAFLEDYAAIIAAYIALYQVCFDEQWLRKAEKLSNYTVANFYDVEDEFFYFTDNNAEKLIARKKELFDNVVPASNSMMAKNLYDLGILLDNNIFADIATKMLAKMQNMISKEPQWLSNWAVLLSYQTKPTVEIALVGENIESLRMELEANYLPNKILVGKSSKTISTLPLLENRTAINGKDTIYVCFGKTCLLPVHSVKEAMKLIKG